MDHETLKERIFALYDGELDAQGRREAEAHLAACAECRETFARWKDAASALFPAVEPVPSEFFVRRVMQRIQTEASGKRVWRFQLNWLAPAAGLAFMFFLTFPGLMPQTESFDTLLSQDPGGRLSWIYSDQTLTSDEALQAVMEG